MLRGVRHFPAVDKYLNLILEKNHSSLFAPGCFHFTQTSLRFHMKTDNFTQTRLSIVYSFISE